MSRPGRGRWCSVISPPVPCPVFLRRRKRREPVRPPDTTRFTSPPAVAARAPATHAPSTGKPVHAARNARDDAREWFLVFKTTSSLAVIRHRSPHSTRPPASFVACAVSRYTLPFLRGVPFRLENGGAGQRRSSTHGTTSHLHHVARSITPNPKVRKSGAVAKAVLASMIREEGSIRAARGDSRDILRI